LGGADEEVYGDGRRVVHELKMLGSWGGVDSPGRLGNYGLKNRDDQALHYAADEAATYREPVRV
jgi:hypothetical protein